jgi:signal transduction histidine kinase
MAYSADLLGSRRASILERWTQRIRWELARPELSRGELWDHLPHLLDELLAALRAAEGQPAASPLPEESPASVRHGAQRLRVGFDVQEVVREYGLLAEIVLDELSATGQSLDTREWRLAVQCFNTAIAEAITAYVSRRDEEVRRQTERHIGFVAHELRNPLGTARSAAAALQLAPADGVCTPCSIAASGSSASSSTRS